MYEADRVAYNEAFKDYLRLQQADISNENSDDPTVTPTTTVTTMASNDGFNTDDTTHLLINEQRNQNNHL